jgi:hypothetical protein
VERRAKMGDGGQGRDSIHGRTRDHRSADTFGISGSYSSAHIGYSYGSTGHDVGMGTGHRQPRKQSRLPNWYHWAIVVIALAGLVIIAAIGVVNGG